MAPGMKLWLGLALSGCALLSIATLPPSITAVRGLPERLPEEVRVDALQRDAAQTANLIRHLRWMDSLPALAVSTARDGLAVGGDPGLAAPEALDAARVILLKELARVPRGDESVVVGFFVQRPDFASEGGGFVDARRRFEFYAGREAGTPYCLVVDVRNDTFQAATLGLWTDAAGVHHSDVLGACRFVAAYGLPGPRIHDWLSRGGFRYLELVAPPDAAERVDPGPAIWDVLGHLGIYAALGDIAPKECLSGQATACADLLLRDTDLQNALYSAPPATRAVPSALGATYVPAPPPALTGAARYLVSDLEHEYGADAFRALWTSDRDVPEAFQAAFGVPVGDWTVAWVAEHVGLERYGPGLPEGAWVGTVLLVLLSALAGGAWHRRRVVA